MEYESYVNLETAKLLKKAGFKIGCNSFYGLDVRHNGESIDENEEYELKARGRKSEIEYVQGGAFGSYEDALEAGIVEGCKNEIYK